ncbi:hypothetical protein E2562_034048 [Oryza meyeriana var. granulata]|uniref:Uncharacterized protein n=1 Tax=Oryza meyeriana var. granulata TaxID=110450 RepID=A0A6G1CAU0_9ORYZ|nr:hypothetical protein E2562_034048 [Oryza meyeriana var. granulata]
MVAPRRALWSSSRSGRGMSIAEKEVEHQQLQLTGAAVGEWHTERLQRNSTGGRVRPREGRCRLAVRPGGGIGVDSSSLLRGASTASSLLLAPAASSVFGSGAEASGCVGGQGWAEVAAVGVWECSRWSGGAVVGEEGGHGMRERRGERRQRR